MTIHIIRAFMNGESRSFVVFDGLAGVNLAFPMWWISYYQGPSVFVQTHTIPQSSTGLLPQYVGARTSEKSLPLRFPDHGTGQSRKNSRLKSTATHHLSVLRAWGCWESLPQCPEIYSAWLFPPASPTNKSNYNSQLLYYTYSIRFCVC